MKQVCGIFKHVVLYFILSGPVSPVFGGADEILERVRYMTEFYEMSMELSMKKNADMEAVLLGKEDCRPSYAYGPTVRAYHLCHFVTRGSGVLRIGGRTIPVKVGDAFLIPEGEMASYQSSQDAPWSYYWVGLTGLRASQYIRHIMAILPERYVMRGLSIEKYAAIIDPLTVLNETNAVNYFHSKAALYQLFQYFAADIQEISAVSRTPSLAAQVCTYLEAKYSEKLPIQDVAAHFGVHPNHLTRCFREAYHTSPKQFLTDLKMKKAMQMLANTDEAIAVIAASLGFEDQHSFSKVFKMHNGISPSTYRKSNYVD